jgi:hypothetical protein
MRTLGKTLLVAALFLAASRARALENTFVVSDTVGHFERLFGVRGRVTAWFGTGNTSTLNFLIAGKANINFRLTENPAGVRYVDQVQIEPLGPSLTGEQAAGYAKFLIADLGRVAGVACTQVRDDQDGINAFLLHSCTEKANPKSPAVDVTTTVQSINGRHIIFTQFQPKKS